MLASYKMLKIARSAWQLRGTVRVGAVQVAWEKIYIKKVPYMALERTCLTSGSPSSKAPRSTPKELVYLLLKSEDGTKLIMMKERGAGGAMRAEPYLLNEIIDHVIARFESETRHTAESLFAGFAGSKGTTIFPFLASMLVNLKMLRRQKADRGDYYVYTRGTTDVVKELYEACPPMPGPPPIPSVIPPAKRKT